MVPARWRRWLQFCWSENNKLLDPVFFFEISDKNQWERFVYKCKLILRNLTSSLENKSWMIFYTEWFQIQREFATPFEEMSPPEPNKCLQKFVCQNITWNFHVWCSDDNASQSSGANLSFIACKWKPFVPSKRKYTSLILYNMTNMVLSQQTILRRVLFKMTFSLQNTGCPLN